jgi:choline dehydrogenase-like flavoprotein
MPDRSVLRNIANVVLDFDDVAAAAYRKLAPDWVPTESYSVRFFAEQVPNPSSRITLTDELDALGVPRCQLNWQLSEEDVYSTRRTIELFGLVAGREGLGRVQSLLDGGGFSSVQSRVGHHHIGTTRMTSDSNQGVVNADCRTHDWSNLYIAGSSVFTTGGACTPTLTIVALALRLSSHLKTQLARE